MSNNVNKVQNWVNKVQNGCDSSYWETVPINTRVCHCKHPNNVDNKCIYKHCPKLKK